MLDLQSVSQRNVFAGNALLLAMPTLSFAHYFRLRHAVPVRANSPSIVEGVPEGRGSNMDIRIPCGQNFLHALVFSSCF